MGLFTPSVAVSRRFARSAVTASLIVVGALGLAAEPTIAYVSRERLPNPRSGGPEFYGRLLLRQPDGTVHTMADSRMRGFPEWTPVDVADPAVSWDGTKIVFAGFSPIEGAWRIYEVSTTGVGLRPITKSDRELDLTSYGPRAARFERYDDFDPCYLPDGRICFVSTRSPGVAPDGRHRTTNLFLVDADGSALHRITSERYGADTPAVDPRTGLIVYSRWWLTPGAAARPSAVDPAVDTALRGIADDEFPGLNLWHLASIRPDGAGLSLFSGAALDRSATMAYRPSFLANGSAVSLDLIDIPVPAKNLRTLLRRQDRGAQAATTLGGPNVSRVVLPGRPGNGYYSPEIPPQISQSNFAFASAEPLPDGRVLVTGAVADADSMQTDVFILADLLPGTPPSFLFGTTTTLELDAVPVVPREQPPVIEDEAPPLSEHGAIHTAEDAIEANGSFRFICENIFANAGVDVTIANAPPVGEELSIEFWMNPQQSATTDLTDPILVDRLAIPASGRIEKELPAGVPLFEVLRRTDGSIPVGRDGQVFHVGGANFGVADSEARCVGCHAGHSLMPIAADSAWTNLAPSATVRFERISARNGSALAPGALIDRGVAGDSTHWIVDGSDEAPASATLAWKTPLRTRALRIYPTTGVHWLDLTVRTTLGGVVQMESPVEDFPAGEPPHVQVLLDPESSFDELRLEWRVPLGSDVASAIGIAEIEVIAEVAPAIRFPHGDPDCDGRASITDAVSVLDHLFRGRGELCCKAAGDLDGDGKLTLTDAVSILAALFSGSEASSALIGVCRSSPPSALGCTTPACPSDG